MCMRDGGDGIVYPFRQYEVRGCYVSIVGAGLALEGWAGVVHFK